MNIHLIRTTDVADELFLSLAAFVDRFPGPARFILHEEMAKISECEIEQQEWEDEQLFRQELIEDQVCFRITARVVDWDHLFEICREFRKAEGIPENERVILLNGIENDKNWFSAGSPDGLDYFVQVNHWDLYVDSTDVYPVAYQLFSIALLSTVYPRYRDYRAHAHRKSRGCIHDFCQDKREIILKLRTADICPDCLKKMEEHQVDPLLIRQVFRALEEIRSQLLVRDRFRVSGHSSILRIEGRNKRIFLPDLSNLEIHLTPIEKTVYLFFLNHPEGIRFTYMADHFPELRKLYGQLSNTDMVANLENRAMALSENQDDCLSQAISRIRRKFEEAIGEDLAKSYVISGEAGHKRKILIDRGLVQVIE